MVKTVNLKADVPATRELDLHIVLPADVPTGPVEIVVVVSTDTVAPKPSTAADLANSEFFGMWAGRTDITDSSGFARQLREQAWRRSA